MPRLFVALDVPDALKQRLQTMVEPHPGAKWVRPEQVHLTLRFIGEAPEEAVPQLIEALGAIQAEAFHLLPCGAGAFPNPRRARVVWIGLEREPRLLALQQAIEAALRSLGFPPDSKPFTPHLTLARIKGDDARWVSGYVERYRDFKYDAFPVTAFHLYESTMHPAGAIYTRRALLPLRIGL